MFWQTFILLCFFATFFIAAPPHRKISAIKFGGAYANNFCFAQVVTRDITDRDWLQRFSHEFYANDAATRCKKHSIIVLYHSIYFYFILCTCDSDKHIILMYVLTPATVSSSSSATLDAESNGVFLSRHLRSSLASAWSPVTWPPVSSCDLTSEFYSTDD